MEITKQSPPALVLEGIVMIGWNRFADYALILKDLRIRAARVGVVGARLSAFTARLRPVGAPIGVVGARLPTFTARLHPVGARLSVFIAQVCTSSKVRAS